jgi:hypothetical protein
LPAILALTAKHFATVKAKLRFFSILSQASGTFHAFPPYTRWAHELQRFWHNTEGQNIQTQKQDKAGWC